MDGWTDGNRRSPQAQSGVPHGHEALPPAPPRPVHARVRHPTTTRRAELRSCVRSYLAVPVCPCARVPV